MLNLDNWPELLSTEELVTLGIFNSTGGAYFARRHGTGPAFIKEGRKVLYPKDGVITFVESRAPKKNASKSHLLPPIP